MHHFFDSSALAKLFLTEPGTDEVTLFVENAATATLVCSELAFLEVRSAIRRKRLLSEVSATHADQALRILSAERQRWIVVPIDARIFELAATCIDRCGFLRSLDALQLGTALLAGQEHPLTLVAADKRLLRAAPSSGLRAVHAIDLRPSSTAFG